MRRCELAGQVVARTRGRARSRTLYNSLQISRCPMKLPFSALGVGRFRVVPRSQLVIVIVPRHVALSPQNVQQAQRRIFRSNADVLIGLFA